MPKFGVDVTNISPTNVRPFIAPGVEDRSAAIGIANQTGLIKDFGGMAIDAYKGKQTSDIERAIQEQAIDPYMEPRRAVQELTARSIELGAEEETLFSYGSSYKDLEAYGTVEAAFVKSVDRYKKAIDQGVMSPEEFHNRTLTVLRDAVNKNPGMMKELSDHANRVLELSGIQGVIKSDVSLAEKLRKEQDDTRANDMAIAKDANIPLARAADGSVDWQKVRINNAMYQNEKALLAAADRQSQFDENQFRTFGTGYATAKINEATDLAIKMLGDPAIPYDKANLQINLILDSVEKGFASDPRVGKVIDKPSVTATHKYLTNQITAIKSNLKGYASKEEAATYLKNSTNMLRDQQYQDMSKIVNPQMLDMVTKLTTSVGVADFISKQPELKVNMYNGIQRILEGLPTNSVVLYSGGDKSPINNLIGTIAKEAGTKDPSPSAITSISNAIKTVDSDTATMPIAEKFNFYASYTKTLASPANKEGLAKLDDNARNLSTKHVNEYANITLTNMKEIVDRGIATGDKITFGVLPDGRLTANSTNTNLTTELNRKFIPRINDSILAISNLNGHTSTKEAAKEFFNTHRSFFMGGK